MAIPSVLWQLAARGGPKFWTTPTSVGEAADAGTASPMAIAAAASKVSRRMSLPSPVEWSRSKPPMPFSPLPSSAVNVDLGLRPRHSPVRVLYLRAAGFGTQIGGGYEAHGRCHHQWHRAQVRGRASAEAPP